MLSAPLSVVMPVHNAMPYLREAIESILSQSFSDFELIVGDDNSSDDSLATVRSYAEKDPRVRVLHSPVQLGPVGSSNWVANAATTPLVARMDADDVALPGRLARQEAILRHFPHAVLVGSLAESIDAHGRFVSGVDPRLLRRAVLPPIAHGSIMYRRCAFDRAGGYREGHDYFEDADLYFRMAGQGALLISGESLYRYRLNPDCGRSKFDSDLVEQRLHRFFAAWLPARLAGTDENACEPEGGQGIDPQVYRSLVMLRSLRNRRPRLLRRILTRMSWRRWRPALAVLGLAALGDLSPAALREIQRARTRLGAVLAAGAMPRGHVFEWRYGLPALDLGPLSTSTPTAGPA